MAHILLKALLLYLFLTHPAFSSPSDPHQFIGQQAQFKTISQDFTRANSPKVPGTYEIQITSYSSELLSFNFQTRIQTNSQVIQYQEWIHQDKLWSQLDSLSNLLKNCEAYEGQHVEIQVPAGRFHSCRIDPDPYNSIWYADVPFGIARRTTRSKTYHFDEQLTEFQNLKP